MKGYSALTLAAGLALLPAIHAATVSPGLPGRFIVELKASALVARDGAGDETVWIITRLLSSFHWLMLPGYRGALRQFSNY